MLVSEITRECHAPPAPADAIQYENGWFGSFPLADDLAPGELAALCRIVSRPRVVRSGAYLYRAGAPFRSLYALRAGSVKGTIVDRDGMDRIVGVHVAGEIIGVDGIGKGVHARDAVTLEDCSVSEIAFGRLEYLSRTSPGVQRNLHRLLGQEIAEKHRLLLALGTMSAPQKVASFLLRLHQRMTARGCSAQAVDVHMTRSEIGSHLGLSLETVSRLVSRMHVAGLVEAGRREIRIKNPAGLMAILRASH